MRILRHKDKTLEALKSVPDALKKNIDFSPEFNGKSVQYQYGRLQKTLDHDESCDEMR